jgi:hypothetical protein
MPIYKAICKLPSKPGALTDVIETRLVEAPNTAAAMRHAAGKWLTIELCTTAEAVELGAAGVKLETVS